MGTAEHDAGISKGGGSSEMASSRTWGHLLAPRQVEDQVTSNPTGIEGDTTFSVPEYPIESLERPYKASFIINSYY